MNVPPKRARPPWPEGSRSSKAEMTPRILLVATSPWFATARIAAAFVSAGCAVEVVCPLGHPATRSRAVPTAHPYLFFAPLHSIGAAIRAARPDLIIPCDDLARSHMIRLYGPPRAYGRLGGCVAHAARRFVGGAVDDVGSEGA